MLSRFCLHSYQNEVLGGPHLSITAGLQLFASLWPGFNSRAYKLSLNSVEQGPFNPLLSPSPDKCSSAASRRHTPPSYLLLAAIRWPALHSHMANCELLYLLGCWEPRPGHIKLTLRVYIQRLLFLWLWTWSILWNLCISLSVPQIYYSSGQKHEFQGDLTSFISQFAHVHSLNRNH